MLAIVVVAEDCGLAQQNELAQFCTAWCKAHSKV
jgi:hypothetical protein